MVNWHKYNIFSDKWILKTRNTALRKVEAICLMARRKISKSGFQGLIEKPKRTSTS